MQQKIDHSDSEETNSADVNEKTGLLIEVLALLPEKAMLDESKLAESLRVTTRTVRRMVSRFELPPPIPLGGRSVWMAGRILQHFEDAMERAGQRAVKEQQRIARLSP